MSDTRETARLGDRIVTTTSHMLHSHDGVFLRGAGLHGTVTIEDFGYEVGAVYVEFITAAGGRWSMPLRPGEYRVVRRAATMQEQEQ